jgi:hypothetical protein
MTKRKNPKSSKSRETNRNETQSEISDVTQKLQDKASRSTESIFSRMLSHNSK